MAAHERRGCLVASDFTCKRLYSSDGSGGATATWCYAEVVPTEPEKGRLLHTLTNWGHGEYLGSQYAPSGVDFPIWSGGNHYPAAVNCSLPPRQWCDAMQTRVPSPVTDTRPLPR